MNRFLILLLIIFCGINFCFASDDVFNHQSTSKNISNSMPQLGNASCKFTQEKYLDSTVLKSGGNFKFIKDKGAIFETLYPVKTTTSYTSTGNKQINEIITSIANKNYSVINKNFNLFYTSENLNWTVALTPKEKSPAYGQIESIIIYGRDDINKLNINTSNGTSTSINFSCGI